MEHRDAVINCDNTEIKLNKYTVFFKLKNNLPVAKTCHLNDI